MPALRRYQIGATICMVSADREVLFALEFVNNVAYLESRSQLESQVLHEHGGAQQQ